MIAYQLEILQFHFYSRIFPLGLSACQHYTFWSPLSFYLYKHNHHYKVLWQNHLKKSGDKKKKSLS